MKKNVFILLFVIATNVTLFAQSFGAKAGVNFANVSNFSDSKSRTGLVGGFYGNFTLGDDFSVQPELLYSAQGDIEESKGIKATSKYDYLSIPIMFQYSITKGLFLQAGPQIGFLLNSKVNLESAGSSIELDANNVKSTDFGLNFGAGYKTDSGLSLDLRYNLGLTDVFKENPTDEKYSNRVIQLTLGFDIVKPKN